MTTLTYPLHYLLNQELVEQSQRWLSLLYILVPEEIAFPDEKRDHRAENKGLSAGASDILSRAMTCQSFDRSVLIIESTNHTHSFGIAQISVLLSLRVTCLTTQITSKQDQKVGTCLWVSSNRWFSLPSKNINRKFNNCVKKKLSDGHVWIEYLSYRKRCLESETFLAPGCIWRDCVARINRLCERFILQPVQKNNSAWHTHALISVEKTLSISHFQTIRMNLNRKSMR